MHISRKNPVIFYGWWVVVSTSLVMLYTSGIIHFGFTAVFEPIAKEFGWSYTQVSFAASLRGMETGLLAPLVGILVDRWGPRRLVFGGCIVSGAGLIFLSQINSLGMFYAAFILIAIGSSFTGHAVMMTAVANWFRRRVSLATGIMASGAALGGVLVPIMVILINSFEWRMAMLILGLGTWAICLPLSLMIRHLPEQYGYLPDGEDTAKVTPGINSISVVNTEVSSTVTEALKSRIFWHITIAMVCHSLIMNAVLTHIMPYLGSIGISRMTAGLIASALPVTSILGRLGFGWLGDRVEKRRLTAAAFLLTSIGLLIFAYFSIAGTWLLVPFLIIFGLGFGGNVTMRAVLLRDYFGRERFGIIHGWTVGFMTVGSVIGAPLPGWIFDRWNSYMGAWMVLSAISLFALLAIATTPRPKETFNT